MNESANVRTSRIPMLVAGGAVLIAGSAVAWAMLAQQPEAPVRVAPSASPSVAATSAPAVAPAEALAAAFEAVTGKRDRVEEKDGEAVVTTTPLKLIELPFGPVLLTATASSDDCHACAGSIGVHYLERKGSGFAVRHRWPKAVSGWGWGQPPTDWSISDKFTPYPAIYAEGGFTGQGITCGSAVLTELRPEGPVASDTIALSYSNGGAVDEASGRTPGGEPARDDQGKIVDIVKDKSFDVRTAGKQPIVEHYVRRGTKFVRTAAESKLAC